MTLSKKKLLLWSLYSYGSAIIFIIFTLYFSQWLVIDRGLSDFWFNFTYITSSVILLFTVPVAADIADRQNARLPWLRWTTLAAFVAFFVTSFTAAFYPEHYIVAAVAFTFAIWLYLFAGTFYNSLLADVSSVERYGATTGWGQFSDWMGEISGVLISIPLITGTIVLWGSSGRAQAFIPASILFLIFSLPILFFYRESGQKKEVKTDLRHAYANMWRQFVELCTTNNLGWFFLSFFFFNDAIITASNNFTIYLDRVFGVGDTVKSFLLLGILISSAIGALISGKIVDAIGFKKALTGVLIGWVVILPLLGLAPNFTLFVFISIAMGLWFGAVWVITRVLTARLAPPAMLSRAFTYYGLMERFATLVGPLTWGLIVSFGPAQGALNYRLAVLGVSVFLVLGLIISKKVVEPAVGVLARPQ